MPRWSPPGPLGNRLAPSGTGQNRPCRLCPGQPQPWLPQGRSCSPPQPSPRALPPTWGGRTGQGDGSRPQPRGAEQRRCAGPCPALPSPSLAVAAVRQLRHSVPRHRTCWLLPSQPRPAQGWKRFRSHPIPEDWGEADLPAVPRSLSWPTLTTGATFAFSQSSAASPDRGDI